MNTTDHIDYKWGGRGSKRGQCSGCGDSNHKRGNIFDRGVSMIDGSPVWVCRNCSNVSPRHTRATAQARRRAELLAELLEGGE